MLPQKDGTGFPLSIPAGHGSYSGPPRFRPRSGSGSVRSGTRDGPEPFSRSWVRLDEKGGKRHDMPCHHTLEAWLGAWLSATGRATTPKAPLFPSLAGRTGQFSDTAMQPVDVWRMIRRRARTVGLPTRIGCHTFRATGITEYLRNGGKLEIAQQMANHESARTTGLYDRRNDQVSLDEIERIRI